MVPEAELADGTATSTLAADADEDDVEGAADADEDDVEGGAFHLAALKTTAAVATSAILSAIITGETPAQPPGGVGGACGNGGGPNFATAVIFGTGTETGCSIDQAARYGDTGGRLDEAAA